MAIERERPADYANVGALVVGEALVDEVDNGRGTVAHAGGSPYNVAIGLARLGVPTLLHTAFGDDDRGALLREHAAASGVALTEESLTDGITSFARAVIDRTGAASYDFTVTWRPSPLELVAIPPLVHVGSIAAVMPPGSDLVADVVAELRPTSLISLDPNVRPQLIAEKEDARARLEGLIDLADLIKVSDEDLEWLYPGKDVEETAADWLGRGPDLVVVTRGRHGATGFSQWGVHDSTPIETEVVDTIGAGDSFTAGLLSGLMTAGAAAHLGRLARLAVEQIEEALSFATRCAAVTVSRAGSQPPWKNELD
ncbi:carbohydrate kinase [Microbacterium pumilum]|uniref:Carbohydrate kinase n=1 Tax=Microbacterium pumilum TaxID=344165 RepID=A0ABP5D287_9MICO